MAAIAQIQDDAPAIGASIGTNDTVQFTVAPTTAAQIKSIVMRVHYGSRPEPLNPEYFTDVVVFSDPGTDAPVWPDDYGFSDNFGATSSITTLDMGSGVFNYQFSVKPINGWLGPFALYLTVVDENGNVTNSTQNPFWDAPIVELDTGVCVCPEADAIVLAPPEDYFGSGDTVENGKAEPVGRDIAQDVTTGEIGTINGDWVFVTEGPAVRQELKQRLLFFLGEWFLDRLAGLPYLQKILGKTGDITQFRNFYRTEIEATPGVRSVRTLDLSVNPHTRTLAVSFSCDTDFGELSLSNLLILSNNVG